MNSKHKKLINDIINHNIKIDTMEDFITEFLNNYEITENKPEDKMTATDQQDPELIYNEDGWSQTLEVNENNIKLINVDDVIRFYPEDTLGQTFLQAKHHFKKWFSFQIKERPENKIDYYFLVNSNTKNVFWLGTFSNETLANQQAEIVYPDEDGFVIGYRSSYDLIITMENMLPEDAFKE